MNLLELHAQLGIHIPPQRAANDARPEIIHAVVRIPQHDGEILRHVLQQDV